MTPTIHRPWAALAWLALCLPSAGCADDPTALPPPDRATFDAVVYPILLQDCGFTVCHGAPDLRISAPEAVVLPRPAGFSLTRPAGLSIIPASRPRGCETGPG